MGPDWRNACVAGTPNWRVEKRADVSLPIGSTFSCDAYTGLSTPRSNIFIPASGKLYEIEELEAGEGKNRTLHKLEGCQGLLISLIFSDLAQSLLAN